MKVNVPSAFFRSLAISNSANSKVLVLVGSGNIPDPTRLQSNVFYMQDLMNWAFGSSGERFLGGYCSTSVPISSSIGARGQLVRNVSLSQSIFPIKALSSNAPTFILFLYQTEASRGWLSDGTLSSFQELLTKASAITGNRVQDFADTYILTCGDEASNAEVRLLGGEFVEGNSYRATNLKITF